MTRTTTLMFTDVVESTARAARMGPRQAESERVTHFELVRRVLGEHGGELVKTLGDGVMAVFDSTVNAIDAAVSLQQRLQQSNRVNPDSMEVRVGVSIGEVDEQDGDVFGPAVVEAARLCAEAAPGQVLCTFTVRALVEANCGHVFESVGERVLKGLLRPVAVEEVRWEALVESGLHANFAQVDDSTVSNAVACLDVQREIPYFREVRDRLMSLLAPVPGQTLLDVGSGTGYDVFELAERVGPAGSVIGIDNSERLVSEATERAKTAGASNVEFRIGRARRPVMRPVVDHWARGAIRLRRSRRTTHARLRFPRQGENVNAWVVPRFVPRLVLANVPRLGLRRPSSALVALVALVAQGIEHRFPKPCVAGSNPAEGAAGAKPAGVGLSRAAGGQNCPDGRYDATAGARRTV